MPTASEYRIAAATFSELAEKASSNVRRFDLDAVVSTIGESPLRSAVINGGMLIEDLLRDAERRLDMMVSECEARAKVCESYEQLCRQHLLAVHEWSLAGAVGKRPTAPPAPAPWVDGVG